MIMNYYDNAVDKGFINNLIPILVSEYDGCVLQTDSACMFFENHQNFNMILKSYLIAYYYGYNNYSDLTIKSCATQKIIARYHEIDGKFVWEITNNE